MALDENTAFMAADGWVTLHPNGKGENADYQRVFIDDNGVIQAGLGEENVGRKASEVFSERKAQGKGKGQDNVPSGFSRLLFADGSQARVKVLKETEKALLIDTENISAKYEGFPSSMRGNMKWQKWIPKSAAHLDKDGNLIAVSNAVASEKGLRVENKDGLTNTGKTNKTRTREGGEQTPPEKAMSASYYFPLADLERVKKIIANSNCPECAKVEADSAVKVSITPKYANTLGSFDHRTKTINTDTDGVKREEVFSFALNHDNTCDECGHKHPNRALSYIVDTKDGMKLIGSGCYDRVQGTDLRRLLNPTAHFVKLDDDEEYKGVPIKKAAVDVDKFVKVAAKQISGGNYLSAKKAFNDNAQSTGEYSFEMALQIKSDFDESDKETLKAFTEYVKNAPTDSYTEPVKIAIQAGYIPWKVKGYVAAMLNRFINGEYKRKVPWTEHFGYDNAKAPTLEIGKRYKNQPIQHVYTSKWYEGSYGTTSDYRFFVFKLDNGEFAVWKTTADDADYFRIADKATFTAKSHGTYAGKPVNYITRAKIDHKDESKITDEARGKEYYVDYNGESHYLGTNEEKREAWMKKRRAEREAERARTDNDNAFTEFLNQLDF